MKHIVKITNAGGDYFLRGTTWAYSEERADRFDTMEAAVAAFNRAKKFTKPALRKLARIEEVEG